MREGIIIREIMRDIAFLAQKAAPATQADLSVAKDLLETLEAHKGGCVGMAANMIGINQRIIAFDNGGSYIPIFNPSLSVARPAEQASSPVSGISRNTVKYRI